MAFSNGLESDIEQCEVKTVKCIGNHDYCGHAKLRANEKNKISESTLEKESKILKCKFFYSE